MILIVGLGNFGMEYSGTVHNAGFMAVDRLCDNNGIEITKADFKSKLCSCNLFGERVVIAKPQTYMNNSGEAVVALNNFYKPDKILIVYDDIDLPFGTIRYRQKGSAGTHNGMKNIVSLMGTEDIPRLRIGVRPEEPIYNLIDYVLSKIGKDYADIFDKSLEDASKKIEEFIKNKGTILWLVCHR